ASEGGTTHGASSRRRRTVARRFSSSVTMGCVTRTPCPAPAGEPVGLNEARETCILPPIVTRPTRPFVGAAGALEVHQVPAATDNLVWIVVCTATREAAIVDGPGADEALAWCDAHDLRPRTILNTHTHHDHIGINRDLLARGALQGWRVFGPARTAAEVPGLTVPVDERDIVALGRAE